MFIFLLWPLFARAPRHWFLENFLPSAPGEQSAFIFLLRSGAATFRRGQSKKKKHHPGCFCFCSGPGKGRGRRSPVGRRHGAKAKTKHHAGCVFFCCGPARTLTHSLRAWVATPRPGGATAKKKTPRVFFFFCCCGPARTLTHSLRAWVAMPRPGGATAKKKTPRRVFFFCCGPARTLTHSLQTWVAITAQKKKKRVVLFFLLRPRADAHSLTAGLGGNASARRGHSKKKHTPGGVFFSPRPARTLTHSLRAWVAMPWPGQATAKKKHHPGSFFFCSGPGERQGKEKPRWAPARGQSKKKNTTQVFFFFAAAPRGRSLTHCGPSVAMPRPGGATAKKNTPGGVVFFAAAPPGLFR